MFFLSYTKIVLDFFRYLQAHDTLGPNCIKLEIGNENFYNASTCKSLQILNSNVAQDCIYWAFWIK